MAQTLKNKPYLSTIIYGAIVFGMYWFLLTNQELIMSYTSKGGYLYALLPIATAFLFSYFHGTFTGNFWTVLGISAAKNKKEAK